MTAIDILLGGILAYGAVKGIWKGLFSELASLVSLLVGIYIAVKFSGIVGNMLSDESSRTVSIFAFLITFIAVVVGITLLAKVFTTIADFSGLGIFNRIGGGVLGLLKMVVILSVALHFFQKINSSNWFAEEKTLQGSLFYYPVLKVSNAIFPTLEEWFAEYKEETVQ